MNMNRLVFAIFASLLIFTACNDSDDDGETRPPCIESSDFNPIDSAEFKSFVDGDGEKIWSTVAFTLANRTTFTECRLDDKMTFNANGTYFYERGESCGAEDNAQSEISGTWEVNFEDRTITFDKDTSNEETGDVIGLSLEEIRMKSSYLLLEVRGIFSAS